MACRNHRNNLWYRGRVTAKEDEVQEDFNHNVDEGKAYVFFTDYGHTDLVDLSMMRRLDVCFTVFPLQAIECCLAGARPAGETWSQEAIQKFKKMVLDQWLTAQVGQCLAFHFY